jgi:hypothetical protein
MHEYAGTIVEREPQPLAMTTGAHHGAADRAIFQRLGRRTTHRTHAGRHHVIDHATDDAFVHIAADGLDLRQLGHVGESSAIADSGDHCRSRLTEAFQEPLACL